MDNRSGSDTARRWAIFAIAVTFFHHIGSILAPFGDVNSGTRVADYGDLLTPVAVIGLGAWAMLSTSAGRKAWTVFAVGALLYVEGHGIHLAANSINNQDPVGVSAATTHFWDEELGHILWYLGFALVSAAIVFNGVVRSTMDALRWTAAILLGVAVTTTAIEGAVVPMIFAFNAAFIIGALKARPAMKKEVLVTYGLSTLLLIVFGIWQGGYPEFSELGWI